MRTINQQRADLTCHLRMVINELQRIDNWLFEPNKKWTQKDINSIKAVIKERAKFLTDAPYYKMEDVVRMK